MWIIGTQTIYDDKHVRGSEGCPGNRVCGEGGGGEQYVIGEGM